MTAAEWHALLADALGLLVNAAVWTFVARAVLAAVATIGGRYRG